MSCQQVPSATDIITYIGVPLTVLGVLPILWNAIRSFWIRRHLASLIPVKARKNTSLIIDSVTGVSSLAARKVEDIDPRLGGCSRMGLYQANVPFFKNKGSSQRVIVDASLRFEPHGIRCDRQTLLFLALGVDPFRNQLHRIIDGTEGANSDLIDTDGRQIMSINTTPTRSLAVQLWSSLSFSERRALAWFCVMVVRDIQGLPYIPLASVKESLNVNFTIPPGVTIMREGMKWLDRGDISLELALTWTFYAESVFYEGDQELLPVPQTVLKTRERALAELKSLPNNELGAHLSIIFSSNTSLIDKNQCYSKAGMAREHPSNQGRQTKRSKTGSYRGLPDLYEPQRVPPNMRCPSIALQCGQALGRQSTKSSLSI